MDAKRLTTLTANTNADLSQSMEDDPLIDGPLISQDALESEIKREFQKLPTTWTAALLTLLHVAYVAACVVLTLLCWLTDDHSEECKAALNGLDAKAVVLLGKVALWLLFFLFERFVQHHHSAARRRGHLHFYRTNRTIMRLPLLIHSAGNAAVLLILAAGSRLEQKLLELPVYLLLAVVCVELLLCVVCLVVYAVRVYRFNKQSPSPDIVEEERAQACSTISHIPTETGFRDGSDLEDVVERQADLIEYLKQHNSLLSKRILELASQHIRD